MFTKNGFNHPSLPIGTDHEFLINTRNFLLQKLISGAWHTLPKAGNDQLNMRKELSFKFLVPAQLWLTPVSTCYVPRDLRVSTLLHKIILTKRRISFSYSFLLEVKILRDSCRNLAGRVYIACWLSVPLHVVMVCVSNLGIGSVSMFQNSCSSLLNSCHFGLTVYTYTTHDLTSLDLTCFILLSHRVHQWSSKVE